MALDLQRDIAVKVVEVAREKGLLINAPRPHLLRFMPALNVSGEEVGLALAMLDETLREVRDR